MKTSSKGGSIRRMATYRSYRAMIQRCTDPRTNGYARYGGRGITVCARWRFSFDLFLEDMGFRPAHYMLDRIDNDRNYEPSNCRWVTTKESALNRRNTLRVHFCGADRPLMEICEMIGQPYLTVFRRIERGWSPQDALAAPIRFNSRWHSK